MPGFIKKDDRHIVPRWQSFRDTVRTGELDSAEVAVPHKHALVVADFLSTRLADWKRNNTVGHASDLVGAGVALGRRQEVGEAAKFLLRTDSNVSQWARELAHDALGRSPNEDSDSLTLEPARFAKMLHARVRSFRQMLRIEPNDPITWVELARNHAALGHTHQAHRNILTALQLAKDNRFVLRSSARFFLHHKKADMAHRIVLKAESTRYDPWLVATELAIGCIRGGHPNLVKVARRMLADNNIREGHLSELASALATLELQSGNYKGAKKLFRRSLIRPTENSLAQAIWVSQRHFIIGSYEEFQSVTNMYEARALRAVRKGDWDHCGEPCRSWYYYQPFSRRPCILGSYVVALALENYQLGAEFAQMGLTANPTDFMLLNNFAFSAAQCDRVDEAYLKLSKVDRASLSPRDSAVFKATSGLVSFRKGEIERGRNLYLESRSEAEALEDEDGHKLAALATTFHALEECRANAEHWVDVRHDARCALEELDDPIAATLQKRLSLMS